jgi:hypothetical protein
MMQIIDTQRMLGMVNHNRESMVATSTGFAEGRAWLEIGKNRCISMEIRSHIVDRMVGIQSMHVRG